MRLSYKIILFVFIAFILGIFAWAIFSPKDDVSTRIYETIKEQQKRADLTFKEVSFEEVVAGVKYWQLVAQSAMVNKSTQVATLNDSRGTFFKKGKAVLRFISPAALWDMKKKEIYLDKPIGYDAVLERKISSLLQSIKKSRYSILNLPRLYQKGAGYWFQAKNLSWKLSDQELVCTGGIMLNKGEVTGFAERFQGDVALERVVLEGNPKIVIDIKDSFPITLEANAFEVISLENLIIAHDNPVIYWGKAKIICNNLKYQQAKETLILAGSVKIDYQDIKAEGDNAEYLTLEEKIILRGNAHAKQADNQLTGKEVIVSLKDQKISVSGKGRVVITEEELK
ncbi:MAG: hypothetical protein KKA31_02330 [Candidatus Margulisbacteria bacterium]|nr:hypothetical protein [Candidatus Margulisiibacteriota bacterium]